jgi:rRNA maturation RNase YbeY
MKHCENHGTDFLYKNLDMSLTVRSRQKSHLIDSWMVRRLAKWTLEITEPGDISELFEHELGVFIIGSEEMARLNYSSLKHEGATDVITLDYGEPASIPKCGPILGDLFICPTVAEENAKDYGTSCSHEVARYLIHGILHLRGYDDGKMATRKAMKQEENLLMSEALKHFHLSCLVKEPKTDRG